ncbi:MAG: hypothetical protein J0L93_09350 [Deltaproteobacteria bacterium]|nr:hypothetical protein [Deltaproteobacteria bacterium]
MTFKASSQIFLAILLVVAAAFSRLIPHPFNFSPIAAMALFGGFAFHSRVVAIFIPLLAMFLSDFFLGFHEQMFSVYLCFMLTALMGLGLHKEFSFFRLASRSLAASLLFFLVTNFDVWLQQPFYERSFNGIVTCYAMALPFFHWTIAGDLFYSFSIFGIYFAMKKIRSQSASPLAS